MLLQDYIKQIDTAVDNTQLDELIVESQSDIDLSVVDVLHVQEYVEVKFKQLQA